MGGLKFFVGSIMFENTYENCENKENIVVCIGTKNATFALEILSFSFLAQGFLGLAKKIQKSWGLKASNKFRGTKGGGGGGGHCVGSAGSPLYFWIHLVLWCGFFCVCFFWGGFGGVLV